MKVTKEQLLTLISESTYNEIKALNEAKKPVEDLGIHDIETGTINVTNNELLQKIKDTHPDPKMARIVGIKVDENEPEPITPLVVTYGRYKQFKDWAVGEGYSENVDFKFEKFGIKVSKFSDKYKLNLDGETFQKSGRRVKHDVASFYRQKKGIKSVPQAGGQKVKGNFQPIYVNPATGEIDYTKTELRPEGWVHIGWRIFEQMDILFIGKRTSIQKFLEKYRIDVNKIIQESGLNPKMVRWTTSKLTKSQPRADAPRQGKGRGEGAGAYKKKGVVTYALPGSGFSEKEKIPMPSTAYQDKPLLAPQEKAAGLETQQRNFDTSEQIKRTGFMDILREVFENKELQDRMTILSLPLVEVTDNRDFLNRYPDNNNNDNFEYASHAFNYYKSQEEFYNLVRARIKPNADLDKLKIANKNLARRFNKEYDNWPETRGLERPGLGKTAVYKLDRQGRLQENFDVVVEGIFSINGSLANDTYTWTASYIGKYGKKLATDMYVREGMNMNVDLVSKVTVKISSLKKAFDDVRTIMQDPRIVKGLKSVLVDLAKKIMKLNPVMVKAALPTQAQIDKTAQSQGSQLSESFLESAINRVLEELANPGPPPHPTEVIKPDVK